MEQNEACDWVESTEEGHGFKYISFLLAENMTSLKQCQTAVNIVQGKICKIAMGLISLSVELALIIAKRCQEFSFRKLKFLPISMFNNLF